MNSAADISTLSPTSDSRSARTKTSPRYLIQVSELTPVDGRGDARETIVYEQRIEGLNLSELIVWINT